MEKAPYIKRRPDGRIYVRFELMPYEQQLAKEYFADVMLAGIEEIAWRN